MAGTHLIVDENLAKLMGEWEDLPATVQQLASRFIATQMNTRIAESFEEAARADSLGYEHEAERLKAGAEAEFLLWKIIVIMGGGKMPERGEWKQDWQVNGVIQVHSWVVKKDDKPGDTSTIDNPGDD